MKYIISLSLISLLVSCGGSSNDSLDEEAVNEKYAEGKAVYDRSCVVCHMEDGMGMSGSFPPLVNSDYLLENPKRALKQVIEGSDEEMIVNGVTYHGIMPPQEVTNEEAVEVVNYILNAWGNKGGEVTIEDARQIRD